MKILGPREIVAGFALYCALATTAVQAETLYEALAAAYENNPVLAAERAALSATDENVAQAIAGWRPSVSANGSIGRNRSDNFFSGGKDTLKPKQASVSLTQSVFSSFRTLNSRREADAQVDAGRARLLTVEQSVMIDAVTAYMDVMRDGAVLNLRRNNVQVLIRQLEASNDRFEVGEITRTDVAQSEARLSRAVSGRIEAEAELARSRAAYQRVIGDMPGTLTLPPSLPEVPKDEDVALEIALVENPSLAGAKAVEEAADHAISTAKGNLGPDLDFVASYSINDQTFVANIGALESTSLVLQATWQLYKGGATSSRIRQAKYLAAQRRIEVIQSERIVRELVKNSWEGLRASKATIESSEAEVDANVIALEGVRQEAEVGSRTTLDVLDAEQELLDSRVELVRAMRNEYVAAFRLLASVGRANAAYLPLQVDQYNPETNYKKATRRWFGWGTNYD